MIFLFFWVKQGDFLCPTLFIIATEVLSKELNALFGKSDYLEHGMLK